MTKADLIEEVSRVVEMTRKESEVIVEAIFDSIVRSLRSGDKIEIRGFGSFRTRQRHRPPCEVQLRYPEPVSLHERPRADRAVRACAFSGDRGGGGVVGDDPSGATDREASTNHLLSRRNEPGDELR